jgi:SAM-dependent methyltransferase
MDQTPAHNSHNPDLLALLPPGAMRVVEVGCSRGALAAAYRQANPSCHYTGIEIDHDFGLAAQRHCSRVLVADVEQLSDLDFESLFPADCFIFGDALEHLVDPWKILRRIRTKLNVGGCVVACIPNMQHWSVQVQLSVGALRYQDSGFLDRTHLRWFTRTTIIELFDAAGYRIEAAAARLFEEPDRLRFLPAIRALAEAAGGDPEQAESDALPTQYIVRAMPKL